MIESKVATATEADWSFTSNSEVMLAVKGAARKAAREFDQIEMADAEQDALLWLAVRPDEVGKYEHREDGMALLSSRIYANALRPQAVLGQQRLNLTTYPDANDATELGVTE